ncbi:hypothetical protein L6R53_07770 [Myxococcota bacterium]|nr:hypothetical protein [Myxococcota bacterium]
MSGRRALVAVAVGAGATLLRLLREGFVVRAIAWPGLLAAGAVVGAALVAGQVGGNLTAAPHLALSAEDAAAVGAAVEAQGLVVRVDPDPRTAVAAGRAERAAWTDAEGWVLAAKVAGVSSLRAEAALREEAGAAWRIEVPADPPRRAQVEEQSGRMGGLVAVLFTLYGVVMGAGLAWRDRGEGVVEASLPLPVPAWTHGAARILALAVALSVGLGATLLLLHGLLAMDRPAALALHGGLAASVAAAVGLAAVGGPRAGRAGFSAPLSRALALTAGLLGLGAGLPAVGMWLPVASLGAVGQGGILSGLAALGSGGAVMAACAAWWGRHHGGLGR